MNVAAAYHWAEAGETKQRSIEILEQKIHILKGYKTELNPNNKQETLFKQCAGTARFVYNWGLAEWKQEYEEGGRPSRYGLCRRFNDVKDDICPWIRKYPYAVTEAAFYNLGFAFKNFFRRIKAGNKELGYPKFKRRGQNTSFQLRGTRIEHDRVRLTHIGWVRLKERSYIPTRYSRVKFGTYVTISQRAGRWFISVLVEEEIPTQQNGGGAVLGVDFGLKSLVVCSDGTVFENPHSLQQAERKLARLNRELSRRTRGSQNWKKTKRKLQRQHLEIANIRKHALHQISRHLTAKIKPKMIVLENLNVAGMTKNRRLSKAISDVAFSELRRQIEYKAEQHGIKIVIADRWFPSSKTCSECGAIKSILKLSERTFVCSECGFILNRDLNAARNLAALGEGGSTAGLPVELERSEALL